MLGRTRLAFELKRFNGWSGKGNRLSQDRKDHLRQMFRNREASYLAHQSQREDMCEHNMANRSYGRQLEKAAYAVGAGPGGRSPEKLEAMRHMLELSQAAKAEGKRSRGFRRPSSRRR